MVTWFTIKATLKFKGENENIFLINGAGSTRYSYGGAWVWGMDTTKNQSWRCHTKHKETGVRLVVTFGKYKLGRGTWGCFSGARMLYSDLGGHPMNTLISIFKICVLYACSTSIKILNKHTSKQSYPLVLHDGPNHVLFTYLHLPGPDTMPAQCLLNLIKFAR